MKRPMDIEEALEIQARMDRTSAMNDAYEDEDTEWKAARFIMSVLREFASENNMNVLNAFYELQNANVFEDYLLWNYQVMHSQDLVSNVVDVSRYMRKAITHVE